MNNDGKVEERLNYKIEFKAEAAMLQNQSDEGAGSFEILVNEKTRYRINYCFDSKTAIDDFQRIIAAMMEDISVVMKTTMGIIGHRVFAKTFRLDEQGKANIESTERELHVPTLLDPNADTNPIVPKEPLNTEILNRLAAAAPRMNQYMEMLRELYALTTTLDFSGFKDTYDMALPRVHAAKKQAVTYFRNGDRNWAKRILQEFPEYRVSSHDLVFRLVNEPYLIPEKLLQVIYSTGASYSTPSHIALEMIARVCGSNPYQYSIKHLEAIKAGKQPQSGKTRKRKHENSISRS